MQQCWEPARFPASARGLGPFPTAEREESVNHHPVSFGISKEKAPLLWSAGRLLALRTDVGGRGMATGPHAPCQMPRGRSGSETDNPG